MNSLEEPINFYDYDQKLFSIIHMAGKSITYTEALQKIKKLDEARQNEERN